MGFVFILFFILSFFVVTFALLHLLAGGAALLKGDKTSRMDLAEPDVPMAKSQPVRFISLLMRWISIRAAETAAW